MLADRPYMRQPTFDSTRSVALILVFVNIAIWVLTLFINHRFTDTYFALNLSGLSNGYLWQFFTFQFLHDAPSPFHLAFNCFALYMFGRAIENALGGATFLKLYLLAGVMGGVLECIIMKLTPLPPSTVIGASAGVIGLVAAFAALFPEQQIGLLFLPFRFRAKHLLWGVAVLDVIGLIVSFTGRETGIAHGAHLGGLVAGFAYIRWGSQAESLFFSRPKKLKFNPRELVRTRSKKESGWNSGKAAPPTETSPGEFISREVDPILDKISEHGIQSLTAREREILEAARNKMDKR